MQISNLNSQIPKKQQYINSQLLSSLCDLCSSLSLPSSIFAVLSLFPLRSLRFSLSSLCDLCGSLSLPSAIFAVLSLSSLCDLCSSLSLPSAIFAVLSLSSLCDLCGSLSLPSATYILLNRDQRFRKPSFKSKLLPSKSPLLFARNLS